MRSKTAWLPLAALLAWSAVAGAAPTPETKDDGRINYIPGGVADADGARGFIVNADRGVDAVDLESGKTLWTFKDGGRPLAVVGDRLLVQVLDPKKGNAARILALDLAEGKKVLESDPLVFPDWVTPGPTGMWSGRSFAAQPRIQNGELWLKWQAHARYSGGAAPTPEILKASMKDADGVAHVNLESGKAEMLASDKAPAAPEVKVSDELRKAAGRQVVNGSEAELKVTTVGDYAVAVDVEADGAKQKVVLKRWDLKTEKALDPATLAEGGPFLAIPAPAAGVVLVRTTLPPKPGADAPAWTVYSLETGKPTATFSFDEGTAEATALGPRTYYVVQTPSKGGFNPAGFTQARTLTAVDLKSGKRIWEHPLEGVTFTPPPP
jgi:hypothetical protein